MSIYHRDYMRDDARRPPGGPSTWSVVTWLLVVNVAAFVLNNLLFYSPERDLFGLSLSALRSFRIWTPLTYQFVHANLWHLLANGLGLFFLGRMLLDLVPPRQVLRIYLFGGLAGGALQLGWNALFGDAIIIGASASVLAIVFAVATLVPFQRIQLLLFFILPVNLSMRQVAWITLAINGLTLLFGFSASGGNGIAVMAHFGGMLLGWAWIRFGWHEARSPGSGRFRIRILREGDRRREEPKPAPRPSRKGPFVTGDVDAILDKINEQGFQSLTDEERRILERGSEKLSRRIDRDS